MFHSSFKTMNCDEMMLERDEDRHLKTIINLTYTNATTLVHIIIIIMKRIKLRLHFSAQRQNESIKNERCYNTKTLLFIPPPLFPYVATSHTLPHTPTHSHSLTHTPSSSMQSSCIHHPDTHMCRFTLDRCCYASLSHLHQINTVFIIVQLQVVYI